MVGPRQQGRGGEAGDARRGRIEHALEAKERLVADLLGLLELVVAIEQGCLTRQGQVPAAPGVKSYRLFLRAIWRPTLGGRALPEEVP